MSKRLNNLIMEKISRKEKLLSIFITAGFPEFDSTKDIVLALEKGGVDFIELGIPFSDPIADGPVIQNSTDRAIENGVNLSSIFEMVREIRKSSQIPIILMGYLNPINKMGLKTFFDFSRKVMVDGFIIPDWELEENQKYHETLKEKDLDLIHLIAPNTPPERIDLINKVSTSFIYCVAYTGVTGQDNKPTEKTSNFLRTIRQQLNHPLMIGFGIKNREDFLTYTNYSDGVIIGSAFIRLLESTTRDQRSETVDRFVKSIREN